MEFGSGEEGLRPESYYIEFPFLAYLFTDTRKYVNAPGTHCGAPRSACELYVRCALPVCSLCLIMFSFPQCRLIIDPAGPNGPSGTGCDSDRKLCNFAVVRRPVGVACVQRSTDNLNLIARWKKTTLVVSFKRQPLDSRLNLL